MGTKIDISDQMKPQFFADAKKGKVLGFKQDGQIKHYRITRLNKSKKICIVEPTELVSLKEADEKIKEDLTLEDVLKEFEGVKLSTTEDVARVLSWVAPPGKKQVLKREAISKLFRATNFQGHSVADSIESYEEF
jgi:hypothetical protein